MNALPKFSFWEGCCLNLSGKFVFPPNLAHLEMPHTGSRTGLDSCYRAGPKANTLVEILRALKLAITGQGRERAHCKERI